MQHIPCNMQHISCNMQHISCNMQQTLYAQPNGWHSGTRLSRAGSAIRWRMHPPGGLTSSRAVRQATGAAAHCGMELPALAHCGTPMGESAAQRTPFRFSAFSAVGFSSRGTPQYCR
jgi:hypothetical protein